MPTHDPPSYLSACLAWPDHTLSIRRDSASQNGWEPYWSLQARLPTAARGSSLRRTTSLAVGGFISGRRAPTGAPHLFLVAVKGEVPVLAGLAGKIGHHVLEGGVFVEGVAGEVRAET